MDMYFRKGTIVTIIIVQILLCILVGAQKKDYFCDETYSYGLANSENYSFIDPETAKQYSETGWVRREYFEGYVQVSQEAPFSFKAAFENQRNDVHPPLYYCVLHVFSLINKGVFTKWAGLIVNYIFLVLIDLLFLYIAQLLLKDVKTALIALLFWTFSGAGLSNILFIRMYMMLTCEILAYVAIHIKIFKQQEIRVRDMLGIMIVVLSGGLTHYYFYFFAFCFSAPICIYLLLGKNIKKCVLYISNLCSGFILALCIFPQALMHVFSGYRGTEVMNNLTNGRDGQEIKAYFSLINYSLFAGKFKDFLFWVLVLLIFSVVVKYFIKIDWSYNRNTKIFGLKFRKQNFTCGEIQVRLKMEWAWELLLIFSYSIFTWLVIKGSEIIHNRYLYPIYPIIALIVIQTISIILRNLIKSEYLMLLIVLMVSIVLCIGSVVRYGIDYLYGPGLTRVQHEGLLQQAQETKGTDCLLYYGDGWLDVYSYYPLRMLHDETYFMRPYEIDNIGEILSRRDTEDRLTVCLPSGYAEEDTRSILEYIAMQAGLQQYRLIYKHILLQEWMLE